jgi:hypothetical protein
LCSVSPIFFSTISALLSLFRILSATLPLLEWSRDVRPCQAQWFNQHSGRRLAVARRNMSLSDASGTAANSSECILVGSCSLSTEPHFIPLPRRLTPESNGALGATGKHPESRNLGLNNPHNRFMPHQVCSNLSVGADKQRPSMVSVGLDVPSRKPNRAGASSEGPPVRKCE